MRFGVAGLGVAFAFRIYLDPDEPTFLKDLYGGFRKWGTQI